MSRYDRRVVVITGAARGIGFGIAQRFASEGASVAVLDLDEAAAQEAAGRLELADGARAVGIGCDVVDAAAVEASVQRVVDELGGIDVLVNNAGITRDNLLFKMTEDDWDLVMNVHLKGVVPHDQGRAGPVRGAEVRQDPQPVQRLRARQPRPGQLLRGQDGHPGPHPHARHRARPVRHHRQRDRARASSPPR